MKDCDKFDLIIHMAEVAKEMNGLSAHMRKIRGVGTNERKRHAEEVDNAASMLRVWVREIESE